MKMHMMSRVKLRSLITYHILLVEYKEFPIALHALKLNISFQQQFAHQPSSWLVNKATSFS